MCAVPFKMEKKKKFEAIRIVQEKEPPQARIDFVAADVCVEKRDGKIVPVVVEINDQDCGTCTVRVRNVV